MNGSILYAEFFITCHKDYFISICMDLFHSFNSCIIIICIIIPLFG